MLIQKAYFDIVEAYIRAFETKQKTKFLGWEDGCNTIVCTCSNLEMAVFEGNFLLFLSDIRFDIDYNIEPLRIFEWASSQESLDDLALMHTYREFLAMV